MKEKENAYEVDVDLPGFNKDEIQMELENGILSFALPKGQNAVAKKSKNKSLVDDTPAFAGSRTLYAVLDVPVSEVLLRTFGAQTTYQWENNGVFDYPDMNKE